ncbi:MAG: hypothetical protein AABX03_04705 [Nanoarchaeota archaeon]
MKDQIESRPYNSSREIPIFQTYGSFVVFNVVNRNWYNIKVHDHKIERTILDKKHVEIEIDKGISERYGLNRLTKYLNPIKGSWSTQFGLVPTKDKQTLESLVRSNFYTNYDHLPEDVRAAYPLDRVQKAVFPYLFREEKPKAKAKRMPHPNSGRTRNVKEN